jgi:hypothetical protein
MHYLPMGYSIWIDSLDRKEHESHGTCFLKVALTKMRFWKFVSRKLFPENGLLLKVAIEVTQESHSLSAKNFVWSDNQTEFSDEREIP